MKFLRKTLVIEVVRDGEERELKSYDFVQKVLAKFPGYSDYHWDIKFELMRHVYVITLWFYEKDMKDMNEQPG